MSSSSSTIDKPLRTVHFTDSNFFEEIHSNREDITLIWLDENMHRFYQETVEMEDHLKQINNYVVLCTDRETCIQSISGIKDEIIVLIISGRSSDDVLSQVHNKEQLDSIFVFCMKPTRYEFLKTKYTKIIDIYTNQNELKIELNRTIYILRKKIAAFCLFDQKTEKSAEYLWFQVIKDVLIKMANMKIEYSKQDMIEKCRDYYRDNIHQLKQVDLFEQTYQSSDAIQWYTKSSSFISCLLSKAFRIQDIELLCLLRFFIIDLWTQLNCLQIISTEDKYSTIYLYHGLKLSINEFDKLRKNIGNFISKNGFLSTSRNISVARSFATNVLLIIETDSSREGITWFDIAQYSMIQHEEEVLFDVGTTFQIQNIDYHSHLNLQIINLRSTENNHIGTYLQENNLEILIAEFYYYMGNYRTSKRYLKRLVKRSKDDSSINNISAFNDFAKLKQIFDTKIKDEKEWYLSDDVSTLVAIADAYQQNENYAKAIQILEKAMELLLKH